MKWWEKVLIALIIIGAGAFGWMLNLMTGGCPGC